MLRVLLQGLLYTVVQKMTFDESYNFLQEVRLLSALTFGSWVVVMEVVVVIVMVVVVMECQEKLAEF